MRSLAILLLLAGAASPALSQDRDRSGDERPMRAERSDRADRAERAERMEARSQAREAAREQRAMRIERQSVERQSVQQQAVEPSAPSGMSEPRPSAFGRQRQGYDIAPRQREIRTIPNASPAPVVSEQTRDGVTTQHRSRDGRRYSGDHRRWDRNHWRGDRRYDWRRYRDRNRSIFRIGLYIDPFGWGYNRWGIGSRLYPNYYRSSYWINDPWMYRLPHAYPPYRWVRYHNDALLVDTWSGEVVDVIYNFFW